MLDVLIALGKAIGLFVAVCVGLAVFIGWLSLMMNDRFFKWTALLTLTAMVLGTAVGFYFSP